MTRVAEDGAQSGKMTTVTEDEAQSECGDR
jgi:hypothetical protein